MPISADRFDVMDDGWPSPGTNADAVLSFLEAHPEQAFMRGEIAEATGVPANSVGPALVRLREAGRVDHKGRYWRSDGSAAGGAGSAHWAAASAFARRVRDAFGDDIEDCYLFGSVARGTATSTSDVDVLVVVSDDADYAAVDDGLLDVAYDLQVERGIRVEVHAMRAGSFERRRTDDPLVRQVVEEGERV